MLHQADRRRLDGHHFLRRCRGCGRPALSRVEIPAGHLHCGKLSSAENGGPERDTNSRADIDLGRRRQRHVNRIRPKDRRPSMEKRRRRYEVALFRKRLGLSEHSCWRTRCLCSADEIGSNTIGRHAKREQKIASRQCPGSLDLQNETRDGYPPRRRCPSRGVSSLTWTAGESRAVFF
jgi:hypothetical protein